MKKSTLFLSMAAVLLSWTVFACQPAQQEPAEEPGKEEPGKEDPGKEDPGKEEPAPDPDKTFTFVASPLQGSWKAGDQIYVHGSIGSWYEVVTVDAANISLDGKSVTAQLGDDVMDKLADPDGLYAAWPDQAVKHLKSKIGSRTTFESCDGLLTAAYLKDKTFTFKDVSGFITFTASGDFDQYAICANNRIGLNITGFEVVYTSAGTTFSQQSDGYPFRYGTVAPGQEVQIALPGGLQFKGGLSLYFGKGGKWTKIYKINEGFTLEPGQTKALGTLALTDYNGPAPRMPQIGERTKYGNVKIAELSGLCLSADEDFIWGVGDEGQIAKIGFDGKVISCVKLRTKGVENGVEKEWSVDSEGVTLDPTNGDILISGEPGSLFRIPAADIPTLFDAEKYYGIQTVFNVSKASGYGNSGTEGVTYYKDGLVLLGAQANSHLFCYDLASKKLVWDTMMWDKDLVAEIAGLFYDARTDWLWIIDSEPKKEDPGVMKVYVYQLTKAGEASFTLDLLGAYPITGASNPESICVDHKNSCIWVGDDLGESQSVLFKFSFTGLDDFNL